MGLIDGMRIDSFGFVGNDAEFGCIAGDCRREFHAARPSAGTTEIVIYKIGHTGAVAFRGGEGVFKVEALKPTGVGCAPAVPDPAIPATFLAEHPGPTEV